MISIFTFFIVRINNVKYQVSDNFDVYRMIYTFILLTFSQVRRSIICEKINRIQILYTLKYYVHLILRKSE